MTMSSNPLSNVRLFVLDMDGTFYLGDRLLDGALDFIKKLQKTGRKYLFFTNNSSKTGEFYREKLRKMGLSITPREIMTSGDVTIDWLNRHHKGKSVFLLGTDLLRDSFESAGIPLSDQQADIVVAAFDTTLCYDRVSAACRLIREGALFVASHPDLNCPTEDGFIPDCGAICAMLTASTGVSPKVLGKPHRETLEAVLAATGLDASELCFVGDRLYTDVKIGLDHGVTSVLVLSGETTPEMLQKSGLSPDLVSPSLGTMAELL